MYLVLPNLWKEGDSGAAGPVNKAILKTFHDIFREALAMIDNNRLEPVAVAMEVADHIRTHKEGNKTKKVQRVRSQLLHPLNEAIMACIEGMAENEPEGPENFAFTGAMWFHDWIGCKDGGWENVRYADTTDEQSLENLQATFKGADIPTILQNHPKAFRLDIGYQVHVPGHAVIPLRAQLQTIFQKLFRATDNEDSFARKTYVRIDTLSCIQEWAGAKVQFYGNYANTDHRVYCAQLYTGDKHTVHLKSGTSSANQVYPADVYRQLRRKEPNVPKLVSGKLMVNKEMYNTSENYALTNDLNADYITMRAEIRVNVDAYASVRMRESILDLVGDICLVPTTVFWCVFT